MVISLNSIAFAYDKDQAYFACSKGNSSSKLIEVLGCSFWWVDSLRIIEIVDV